MKKVISVHLNNELFQMEEDGYAKVQKVLRKIEAGSPNGSVLVKDIEAKIAGMIRVKASANNLITEAQVIDVLNELGYAAYLNDLGYGTNPGYGSGYKKLYRHPADKVLGGVCSGIAVYVNTDPVLIRVLLVVLFFGFGFGLLLYLILWIIVPQALSIDQMYGNDNKI